MLEDEFLIRLYICVVNAQEEALRNHAILSLPLGGSVLAVTL